MYNQILKFKTVVRPSGNSGHIILPDSFVGKEVEVSVKLLLDDYNTIPALDIKRSSKVMKLEFMPSNV